MSTTTRTIDVLGAIAYVRSVVEWSSVWLFVVCYGFTLWRLGRWLAG